MRRRTLSMNRTLSAIIVVGYAALVALLLLNTLYSLGRSQREQRQAEREALAACANALRSAMDVLDKYVYDVWATDRDFLALSGGQSETENYESAYYLRDALSYRVPLEDAMHGFILFFDGAGNSWYRAKDIGLISMEQMRAVIARLERGMKDYGSRRSWITVQAEGDLLLAAISRRQNAAIAMLYNTRELGNVAAGLLGGDCELALVAADADRPDSPQPPQWVQELGVAGALAEERGQYEGRLKGRRVYARYIPKVDLWLTLSVRERFWGLVSLRHILLAALSAVSILAVALLFRFFQRDFAAPMEGLTRVMEQVRTREITQVPMLDVRFREMQDVNRTLAAMVSEIEAQKLTLYEEIIERQKAQMQYLQLQLRPHFYLNGLKTINAMAINGDTRAIQEVSGAISGHLRYLFQENQRVSLADELAFVDNYIAMQELAFGRSIALRSEVAEEARACLVPILCVQTFVENSVKYARTAIAGTRLEIGVRVDLLHTEQGRYLDVMVSDNGQGYTDAMLERINSGSFGDDGQAVGIGNVIRRCRLIYGERAELNFYNDGGAVSELILLEHAGEGDGNERADRG